MATVYLGSAEHEDGSEELVALKVIRDELAHDEQFTSMFIDEAKILARLSHPNVIQTLEYGVTGNHHYIAMELLSGRTAADIFDVLVTDKASLDLHTAAWICARVAEGLHSAHELVDETHQGLNVIHRDVNPTNIFLTHSGEVKLIDFGLARARVRVSKSAEGIVKGKIPYLAPEQAYGRPIDRRIDLYALGTTLWELCTTKRLFKRDNDIDTLKAIRDAHVPNPKDENPDFPEALWNIIDRALKRERDERYSTAEELRADLDAFARTSPGQQKRLAELVSRLFPNSEAQQAQWLRNAKKMDLAKTMTPPAPVPIASSSMLEAGVAHPSEPPPPPANSPLRGKLPPPTPPPKRTGITPMPTEAEEQKVAPELDPKPAVDAKPASPFVEKTVEMADRPAHPSRPETDDAKTVKIVVDGDPDPVSVADPAPLSVPPSPPRKPGQKKKKKKKKSGSVAPKAPSEDKKKLWLMVGALVFVFFVIAMIASR